jgi:hypothetical protein
MLRGRKQRGSQALPKGAGEVVYFVRAGDAVKIGRTANLASRLRALATGSAASLEVLASVPGGREREAEEHRRCRHLRIRGEWFRADESLVRYAREQAGGPVSGTDPRALAQEAQFRRVLAALDQAASAPR